LVPATSFYEWHNKVPFQIHLNDRDLFSMAGLFITCRDGDSELKTFTIITTVPNSAMKPIHDRMPVILDREEEQAWLSHSDPLDLLPMLDPYRDSDMEAYKVDKAVGNIRNNYPELLVPVK
jgi:putative SOS response-associated peptidase YedK